MKISKYLGASVSALLLVGVIGCSNSESAPIETPADTASLDLPVDDNAQSVDGASPMTYSEYPADALSAPVVYDDNGEEEVISRMDPDALAALEVPADTQEAVRSLLAFQRQREAGQSQFNQDEHTAYGPQLAFGRYPTMTDVQCELQIDTDAAQCWAGKMVWPAQQTVDALPYLLNEDVLTYHDGKWRCDEQFCINDETYQPVGRIQPQMARYLDQRCEQFVDGIYRCWDFM